MHIAKKRDFFSALIILIVMGICWFESRNIDIGINFALGPLFFPYLTMGLIVLFAVILALRSISWTKADDGAEASRKPFDLQTLGYRLALIAITLVYLIVLPYAGYTACTVVFLIISMCCLGKRNLRQLGLYTLVAVLMTFALYWVFSGLLHLFLP